MTGLKHLHVTVSSSSSVTVWSLQNLVSVFSCCVSVRTARVMLFCDRWQCFAWLVNLTAVAVYGLLPYFWCSTVDSIQLHVACCVAVSCRCSYIADISLVQLLPWSCPKCLPADTCRICVMWGCGVLATFTEHWAPYFWNMMGCIILYCIIMCFLILVPIILNLPADINHVKYFINIVEMNNNYVFLSEYSNWTTDSTCWRESVHVWRV